MLTHFLKLKSKLIRSSYLTPWFISGAFFETPLSRTSQQADPKTHITTLYMDGLSTTKMTDLMKQNHILTQKLTYMGQEAFCKTGEISTNYDHKMWDVI